MIDTFRLLSLSLLLATSTAGAADPSFYFISITDKNDAVLFGDTKNLPKGELSYALLDRPSKGCCFKAGIRPGARKKAQRDGDGDVRQLMSEDDKPVFRHAGYLKDPAQPELELELAYGFEGMQSVKRKKRDIDQVTLQAGAPVFVHSCYTGEGLRLRLFRRLSDKKPYASYYYYLGYEVEPTCR